MRIVKESCAKMWMIVQIVQNGFAVARKRGNSRAKKKREKKRAAG
jgi:hypothetical protein